MPFVELPGTGTVLETDDLSLWPEAKRLTKAEGKRRLKDEAIKALRKILKPGDTVHTVLRHVSSSGMSRRIDLYKLKAGDKIYLTGYAARAMDERISPKGGIVVGGCGMDMGFHLVYNLSYAIWPDGFTCTGDRCPSNDHSNGDRNRKPHKHNSGGYALHHEWL